MTASLRRDVADTLLLYAQDLVDPAGLVLLAKHLAAWAANPNAVFTLPGRPPMVLPDVLFHVPYLQTIHPRPYDLAVDLTVWLDGHGWAWQAVDVGDALRTELGLDARQHATSDWYRRHLAEHHPNAEGRWRIGGRR